MPRIFKGSESTLRLLLSKSGDYQSLTDIKIKLYTTNIENAIEIIDGITIEENIATITLAPRAFMGMEDGLINYIIDGASENDVFHTERQSNYMLKTLSYINEDGVATQTMTIDSNGEYRITPNDGLYVDISVNVEDVNGSFDEGFNVGYEQGKTDGVNEQMSKLESINITENGTYTKEDGYNFIEVNVADLNGSYDEGYTDGYEEGLEEGVNNAGGIIAENARVLEVTENGLYVSRYSEIPAPEVVTGVFDDGTPFYNYVQLGGKVFDTNIIATPMSRLEFWYKGDNKMAGDGYNVIIGAGKEDGYAQCYVIRYYMQSNSLVRFEIGYSMPEYSWDEGSWHHIVIAKKAEDNTALTLWIDDVEICGLGNIPFDPQSTFYINGIEYDKSGARTANGCFGMIKIDDTTIIPTKEGFLNTNTGELLETVKNGGYIFTDNMMVAEGELYKTIKVNMTPKVYLAAEGIKFAYCDFETVPQWADFENITNTSYLFSSCYNLKSIEWFNTEMVDNASYMFNNCHQLKTMPNNFNFGNCVNMDNFFASTNSLNDYTFLETWVINPMAKMNQMISNTNATYVPAIPCVGNTDYNESAIFWSYSEYSKLTYFGGWIGRKYNITKDQILKKLSKLTYESCISILNNLYDFTGNGETPGSNQGTLKVHQNFLDTVGEDILIGINKGWTITA